MIRFSPIYISNKKVEYLLKVQACKMGVNPIRRNFILYWNLCSWSGRFGGGIFTGSPNATNTFCADYSRALQVAMQLKIMPGTFPIFIQRLFTTEKKVIQKLLFFFQNFCWQNGRTSG